jgi:nitrogen fixation protein FixH
LIGPLCAVAMLAACSGSGNAPATTPVAAPPAPAAASAPTTGQELNISFKSDPARPKTGDNKLEVSVTGADGKPVDDATVTAQFYMPAMPAMNMPEMRNNVVLQAAGNGVYRGVEQLEMAGTWNVTVNVVRNGEKIGSRKLTLIGE